MPTPQDQFDFPRNAAVVTPSDTVDLPTGVGMLYIGGAGNVNVDTASGQTVLFNSVTAGSRLPVLVKRVRATSTTATNMRICY